MFGKGFRKNRTEGRLSWEPVWSPVPERGPVQVRAVPARRSQAAPPPLEERVERLDEAAVALGPYLREATACARMLVNPLLVVWDAAHAVHPEVATPVEELLTGLLHRTTIPVQDVLGAIDDVRARALQELVLGGWVMVG